MQQRYLLTPGGQRLYSTAKLDVEWENIFFIIIIIYPQLRALFSYRSCLRGLQCLPRPVGKYYVRGLTYDTPAAVSRKLRKIRVAYFLIYIKLLKQYDNEILATYQS